MDQSVQFAESMNLVVGSGFAGERQMCGVEPAGAYPGAVGTENVSGKGVADKQDFFLRTGFDVGEDMLEKSRMRFLCADLIGDEDVIHTAVQSGESDALMLG